MWNLNTSPKLRYFLLDMDFVPNKTYKIMDSAHLKGGSLENPRPLLSINKEPTSFERALGLFLVSLPSTSRE